MHIIRIHKVLRHLMSVFYYIRLWHRGDKPSPRELIIKWFYFIYFFLFLVALIVGASQLKTIDESIFTSKASLMVLVLVAKLGALIWKQEKILVMMNRIAVFSIRHDESFAFCSNKLDRFMKFVVVFLSATVVICVFVGFFVPLLASERYILFKIAFPLDWRNSIVAFWLINFFLTTESFLTLAPITCSIMIWYLMICCSLKYEVLAKELKYLGQIVDEEKKEMSQKEIHRIFLQDLKMAIISHKHIRRSIDEFQSFSGNLFFVQFCTSGLCICASTYCLAFDISENMVIRIIFIYSFCYNVCELFMITYFGNEIMLSSNRLSYSLFESQWIEQPQSTNKYVIIFGEYLKRPHTLLIGKLYPLTLETFNKILNSAYSMFNLLKSSSN